MGFPVSKAVNIDKLSKRSCSYGINGLTIDGNDVLGVYNTVTDLTKEIRNTGNPIVLECETYRWKGHSRMDAERYRTKQEVEAWKKKCPILRFKNLLTDRGIFNLKEINKLDDKVKKEIERAREFAKISPFPEPKEATEDVYA